MDFLWPPVDRRGRFIQLTSYDRGPVTAAWVPPLLREWSRKCVMLKPEECHEAGRVDGAGIVSRLFVALPAFWNPGLFREIVLRIYWDGESEPSVEAPLGDFFGIHHCRYRQYDSRLFSVVSGGITCHAPMPFSGGFRVTFTQEGSLPVPLFFYGIGYFEMKPGDVGPLRFHANWRRQQLVPEGNSFTFLEARGNGLYAGLHLSTQNRDAWLRPPVRSWMLPRGFGLGHLEGWEEIFVDGEGKSRHRGTGHEEYFNTGWYFRDGAFAGTDWGCLHRSYLSGRTASYRYHWKDAIPFRESIRGVIHHGTRDEIPADYSATSYWYQVEPHAPFPPLPVTASRQVTPVIGSRLAGY